MDKTEFIEKYKTANGNVDMNRVDSILRRSLSPESEKFEGFTNLIIAMEEFAECQQEVSKVLRDKGDLANLLQETADAYISIRYIQLICKISDEDLNKAINVKIDRQAERVEL